MKGLDLGETYAQARDTYSLSIQAWRFVVN